MKGGILLADCRMVLEAVLILSLSLLVGVASAGENSHSCISTSEVTSVVSGDATYRILRLERHGSLVMTIYYRNERLWMRSFHLNGELVSSESDEDNDGFLELLSFYGGEDAELFEAFVRTKDGDCTPVSSQFIADRDRQLRAIAEGTGVSLSSEGMHPRDDEEGVEPKGREERPGPRTEESEVGDGVSGSIPDSEPTSDSP